MRRHSRATKRPDDLVIKETSSMLPRFKRLALAVLAALALSVGAMPVASAAAAQPWWQVLTGSRPTNLWEPTDNVQEIKTATGPAGVALALESGRETVGCLATGFVAAACVERTGFPAIETAAQLEARLEAVWGTTDVQVTGGPVGGAPFVVRTPGRGEPTISVTNAVPEAGGSGSAEELSGGGSGRLVLTLTNLGDAPVVATSTPVTITDKLPPGVEASGVEAVAGAQGGAGPVPCEVVAADEISCSFEGELPAYEAIEVQVLAFLTGQPPAQVAAGEVAVSGGDAPAAAATQHIAVSPDPAPFGFETFSAETEEEGGSPARQAGGHPFQFTTTIQLNSARLPGGAKTLEQPALPRNFRFPLPAGFIGNALVAPQCPMESFFRNRSPGFINECPAGTVLGATSVTVIENVNFGGLMRLAVPVFNLPPGHGEPARFGFMAAGTTVVIDTKVNPDDDYRIIASVQNTTQVAKLLASTLTMWGTPGDPAHDASRGWDCVYFVPLDECQRPSDLQETPFLRAPVSCSSPLGFGAEIEPWNVPVGSVIDSAGFTADPPTGCNRIPFDPTIKAAPTNQAAETPSGLEFHLGMPNSGLLNKDGIAEGQAKKVEVTLPEGVTVNPSQANGLGACSPVEYARETSDSAPGEGCPESSKIGSVDITTPLLEEEAHGAVYVAKPYDNPFGSLLALYIVAKIPERGVLVKQAGKVSLDPTTGQIVTTFDDLPQIPFETFDLHFKEGDRAPLVMPGACGSYDVVAKFTPWHASNPDNPQPGEIVTRTSRFTVDQGPNGKPCPNGTPPFKPGFSAGTANNAAGSYSPLSARLTREDGEQEFTRFSMKLPQGVLGRLVGVPFCPEAAIAAARARTGPNGGQEELDAPSCPAASAIGQTLVGAGVGSSLTYAPGKLYLAGPYRGSKLSVVAITTAKVGPFDLGTVVIRQALRIDPETAEVTTNGSSSDPIPHILQGVVVHARDIRINVDRPDFVLNPTSCERMDVAASVAGSAQPVDVSAPFQAADCAGLGFKPRLSLSLRGGTRRGDNPRLKAVVSARKGDANIGAAVVTLPHSAFLDQAHIRTVCTRVQFNAGGGNGEECPAGAVYGHVRAVTPLLDEPLRGPVYLRSSNHPLPDLVAALHSSKVDINLVGRIDSVGNGRIRNIFAAVPDAPVSRFTLEMQGGRKGLLVNSTNICRGKHRASATFTGQNGKRRESSPLLKAKCGKSRRRH